MDSDCTPDPADLCIDDRDVPSACAVDTDLDGYGNRCDGDFNNDAAVDGLDAVPLLDDILAGLDSGAGTDMNCDGAVDGFDVNLFRDQLFQGVPGPSCAGDPLCP